MQLLGAFRYENIDGNEKRKKRAIGFKVMFIQGTIGNDDFLRNTAFAMFKQCCYHLNQCRNIATLCCAKNRRCESSRVTSPLMSKTTILHVHHTFLYIALTSMHDYDVKMPNSTFCGGRKQASTNLSSSY